MLNNKRQVLAVFISFKRHLNRSTFSSSFVSYAYHGCDNSVLSLFTSYFSNRMQCVKVNGFTLTLKSIVLGLLGPLLFLIYINDHVMWMCDNELALFADDTTITIDAESRESLVAYFGHTMDRLDIWLIHNRLFMNNSKTKVMIVDNSVSSKNFLCELTHKNVAYQVVHRFTGLKLTQIYRSQA
jgi:hypothetical protein